MFPSFMKVSHWLTVVPILHTAAALPTILGGDEPFNATRYLDKRAEDFFLRILPLGGSITLGWGSSTGNGYRKPLRDQLRKDGWNVNMVGTKTGGTNAPVTGTAMKDDSVEAVAGYEVTQIQGILEGSLKYLPNLVLVNAGVNDCTYNDDIDNIGTRMGSLLDTIFNNIDGTTVILSTLLPSLDSSVASCHDSVNSQYRDLITTRSGQGQKIVLAEMAPSVSYWDEVEGGDYYDSTHPNDSGHAKMASIWYEAFGTAYSNGWLTAPADTSAVNDTASDNTCQKVYGDSQSTEMQTQSGSGWDDGIYIHHGDPQGERFYSGGWSEAQNFYMASITTTGGLDDIIQYSDTTSGDSRKYTVYRNTGAGTWSDDGEDFWIPDSCIARGVRWADMNGDGLDDFVCIAPNGDAVPSFNRGGLTFENLGIDKYNEGPEQKYIRLGDIDGDGRCDYCALSDDGSMSCWRNGGLDDISDNWQAMGIVFDANNFGDIDGVRLVDINGDGRADYLWVDDDGQTWTYTNNRGCEKGDIGQGLTPTWRAGENREYGAGPTMIGIGVDGVRDQITFSKAYGYIQAYDFLPSRDYVYIAEEVIDASAIPDMGPIHNITDSNSTSTQSNSTGTYTNSSSSSLDKRDAFLYSYRVNIWQNVGTGGGKLKADGDRYCNMMGRANGRQDYVWIWSNGMMWIWEALDEFPSEPKYWGDDYLMWDITASRSMDRRDLHLADWDGDGACDIIYTNPDGGALEVWINQVKTTGNLEFDYIGNPAPEVGCDQTRGIGQFDLAVRLADVTGNGLPDYLCIEKDGRTKGYVHNTDGTFTWIDQIKQSDGYDRANFRHADVDGDGLADLIWTDKFKGDAMVWKNMGEIPAEGTGSSFTWVNQGFLWDAPAQGTCLHFTDLDGNSRADMVWVDAVDNWGYTWFNNCPDSSGDDTDTFTSADLPAPPDVATSTSNPVLRGLYSFGDSYAAGIGTGTTSGDTCRQGSRSYPVQMYSWLSTHGSPSMNHKTVACSGDTTDGVAKQIENWSDADNYDVITLSVGGNDIGFSTLVYYCILTPSYSAIRDAELCAAAKQDARDLISDTSENGLGYQLKEIYKSVMTKAQSDTHLYITSYTGFFNQDYHDSDEVCTDVTFSYWNPRHDPSDGHSSYVVYLDPDTRADFNNLVNELNTLIFSSIDQANTELGISRIHGIDISSAFDSHRWCEWYVDEPDENREDTWFFLAAWKDFWADGYALDDDSTDLAELEAYGQVPIPDADTCDDALGANPDLYDIFLCRIAEGIQADPSGKAAISVDAANTALYSGNYSSTDVPFWMPTRTAKMFHPRSLGHSAIRSAVIGSMVDQGQYLLSVPDADDAGDVE